MKLLQKLLIGILVLILLSSTAIGSFSYWKSSTSTNELMMSKVQDQLNLRTDLIQEKINSTVRMIELISAEERIKTRLMSGVEDSSLNDFFTSIVSSNSDLISLLSITDQNGFVINVDEKNSGVTGADLSARDYLKDAISTKKTVVSDLIISKASGTKVMAICKPIYNETQYVGAVIATIDFSMIEAVISDTQIAKEGYAYLLDTSGSNAGTIVSHPNKTYVEEEKKLYDFNQKDLDEITDKMIESDEGSGYYTFEGESKYIQFKKVENWTIAITANDSDLKASSITIRNVTIIVLVMSILMSMILGYVIIKRWIVNPIHAIEEAMEEAGNGNLNVNVENYSKDEIGSLSRSFMKMINNIHSVLTTINAASHQVHQSSGQVSDSSLSLSQGATEQASAVEELSATIDEITSQARKSADNARHAQSIVDLTRGHAEEGNQKMIEMLSAMSQINDSSESISRIIKVIDDIAFQTNILALNAAVEAARAGQHGKGFAVVAEEVRNLAARSADAAKETTDLIETSVTNVKKGTSIADNTATALKEIVENISETAELMLQIAEASTEQAVSVDQIHQGINQISDVIQTTSATAEETAAASEELSSQADMLKQEVQKFNLRH
ncbi:MAG: Cache 3/Cache 2 fusion domain-containing protein [Clostridia bacterium]|nr:Cache 3/Cache 2 fusion domain-containing protein [Clostridia bacterium]